jgi:hypothetical protein
MVRGFLLFAVLMIVALAVVDLLSNALEDRAIAEQPQQGEMQM